MPEKKQKKIYQALLDGATEGLADKALFDYVLNRCPQATSKKIVRASLLALTDPSLKDATILRTIYALAIKHRVDALGTKDLQNDDDD